MAFNNSGKVKSAVPAANWLAEAAHVFVICLWVQCILHCAQESSGVRRCAGDDVDIGALRGDDARDQFVDGFLRGDNLRLDLLDADNLVVLHRDGDRVAPAEGGVAALVGAVRDGSERDAVKRRVDGFVFAEQDESGSAKTDHQNDADDT